MRSAACIQIGCGLLLAASPAYPEPSRLDELQARRWHNNPIYRLNDERDVVLFFFDPDDKQAGKQAATLNRLSSRKHDVVIGLTEASGASVERFLRKFKVRFTVGEGSRSRRSFGVERTPAIIRVSRKGGQCVLAELQPTDLGSPGLEGLNEMSYVQAEALLQSLRDPAELREFIESDAESALREDAVDRLFQLVPPAERKALSDELAEEDLRSPRVAWRVEFRRRQARGAALADQVLSPSSQAYQSYAAQLDAPEWRETHQYKQGIERRSVEALLADYDENAGTDAVALVVRRLAHSAIVRRVTREAPAELRAQLREKFLAQLQAEPDFGLRGVLAISIRRYADPGDVELADQLDMIAQQEPNIYHVRPRLEELAENLRSGSPEP